MLRLLSVICQSVKLPLSIMVFHIQLNVSLTPVVTSPCHSQCCHRVIVLLLLLLVLIFLQQSYYSMATYVNVLL